jgi:hypothetical protein
MDEILIQLVLAVLGALITMLVLATLSISFIWWVVVLIWLALVFLGVVILDGDWS